MHIAYINGAATSWRPLDHSNHTSAKLTFSFTQHKMGNSASVSHPPSPRLTKKPRCHKSVMLPCKGIFCRSSTPSCLVCISTESLACFSTDISRLPEKVFRVLVDPSGKGYTVDEDSIDLNLSPEGKQIFNNHHCFNCDGCYEIYNTTVHSLCTWLWEQPGPLLLTWIDWY